MATNIDVLFNGLLTQLGLRMELMNTGKIKWSLVFPKPPAVDFGLLSKLFTELGMLKKAMAGSPVLFDPQGGRVMGGGNEQSNQAV